MNLKKYKEQYNLTWDKLGDKVGLSGRVLEEIQANPSRKITLETAIKIKLTIGLECWEYLNYCEDLKIDKKPRNYGRTKI